MKLIVCFLIFGLQNPSPTSGDGGGSPSKSQPEGKSEQAAPRQNAPQKSAPITNGNTVYDQKNTDSNTDERKHNSDFDGMTLAERLNIRLTAILCMIGFAQCCVYVLQWGVMRKSSQRGLRAYLCLINNAHDARDVIAAAIDTFPDSYSIFIKNSGQTPAYRVCTYCAWRTFEGRNAHWPDDVPGITNEHLRKARAANRGSSLTLGSGQIHQNKSPLSAHSDGATFIDAFQKFMDKEVTIYIFGVIFYVDIYKRKRKTKFCMVIREDATQPDGFMIGTYDRHNEAN